VFDISTQPSSAYLVVCSISVSVVHVIHHGIYNSYYSKCCILFPFFIGNVVNDGTKVAIGL
jgi:hypothetical protein